MLLNMSNEESYVKDEVAGAKIEKLPSTLSCSAVFPEQLPERRGGLEGRRFMAFQTWEIPKLWGQYFDMLLNMIKYK